MLVSFGLTILCFSVAAAVSQWAERGIATSAEGIVSNAVPSVDHLANARTSLRRLEVAVEAWSDRIGEGDDREPPEIANHRRLLARSWNAYVSFPTFAGERELQLQGIACLSALDGAIAKLRQRIAFGDPREARRVVAQEIEPAIDRLDENLSATLSLNAHNAAELGGRIAKIRGTSRAISLSLALLSAAFAVVAAVHAVRIVRRYSLLMEQRMSEVERFSDRVAHDLRSPLAAVSLGIGTAQSSPALPEGVRLTLARAGRTVLRIGDMVEGLLLFARAGRTDGATEVATVIEDVLARVAPLAESRGIAVGANVDPCRVACSSGVLTSMVANLVDNAIKFMGDASIRQVSVRVRPTQDAVNVEVDDTGPGVAPQLEGRLFLPYSRAGGSTIPGIGLGLATVRRLAESHGGSVGVDSAAGRGSRFWFTLPQA